MPYLDGVTSEDFDLVDYLARCDIQFMRTSKGRRWLTRLDPLLFGLLYFPHHLRSGDNHEGPITLADFHLDMCRRSRHWIMPGRHRAAEVAPRDSGKSTFNFLIRPMWALAHRHRKFVAAFADSGAQAEQHLISFKQELDENELLRQDFPGLVSPAKRISGVSVADNRNLYVSQNKQVFMAKGIDSSTLGAKLGVQRPDLILFDDIEPDEANYSEYQKDKRCSTIINAVLPMNLKAAVIISGTVTMPGSIVHDLVRTITEPEGEWREHLAHRPNITEEGFEVNYYPALYQDDAGDYRSIWPQRWSVGYLRSISHTASFKLNFQNSPRGRTGGWWSSDDFHYETLGERATRWMLQVDPAVSTKGKSDYTGLAVVAFAPPGKDLKLGRCEVAYAVQVKMVGKALRDRILQILEWFPKIRLIRVESNQGGENWHTGEAGLLHGVPCKVIIHNSSVPKEVRLARGLDLYQRPGKRVVHTEPLNQAEEQMISYPNSPHDDIVDAICLGLDYFLPGVSSKIPVNARSTSYIGRS